MSDVPQPSSIAQIYHWINRHGLIIGILAGGIISLVFWWLSWDTKELSYAVRSGRNVIFDATNTLGLTLVPKHPIQIPNAEGEITTEYKDLPPDQNVYSVQLMIWNSGNSPIWSEDVLSALKVHVGDDETVYDITVVSAKRSDITKFEVTLLGCHPADEDGNGSCDVGLHWHILEPNDYAIVQVTYGGDSEAEVLLDGTIVGQQPITLVPYSSTKSARGQRISLITYIVFVVGNLLVVAWVGSGRFGTLLSNQTQTVKSRNFRIFFVVYGLLVTAAVTAAALWNMWSRFPTNF
jgi:hypothetical protein